MAPLGEGNRKMGFGERRMGADEAERIAIAALAHLAGNDDLMMRFLSVTGITATEIRAAAADPGFLAGVLDFLLGNEPDAVAFAHEHSLPPEDLMRARAALGGGVADPWLSI